MILQGDAAHLPFRDASVDLVCTSPPTDLDRDARVSAFGEIARVAKHRVIVFPNAPGQWSPGPGFYPAPTDEWVRDLIAVNSEPGDVVLDCFAGIGTIPRVAREMGRVGFGVELYTRRVYEAVDECRKVA